MIIPVVQLLYLMSILIMTI